MLTPSTRRSIAFLIFGGALLVFGLWSYGVIPTYAQYCEYHAQTDHEKCASYHVAIVAVRNVGWFLDSISPALTAIATAAIGWFTYTIWKANQSQLKHGREVERAYLTGGGGPEDGRGLIFKLDAANYGKTPAFIFKYAIEFCNVDTLPAEPDYKEPYFFSDRLAPGERKLFDEIAITGSIAYGRFWYRDIWGDEHSFGFILTISGGRSYADVVGVSSAYTDWT
jgi:hypothetical protein